MPRFVTSRVRYVWIFALLATLSFGVATAQTAEHHSAAPRFAHDIAEFGTSCEFGQRQHHHTGRCTRHLCDGCSGVVAPISRRALRNGCAAASIRCTESRGADDIRVFRRSSKRPSRQRTSNRSPHRGDDCEFATKVRCHYRRGEDAANYPVLGKTTLLDVLSQAQGLADDAGNIAIMSRGKQGENVTGETTQSVDLKKLLDTGSVQYNLAVFPGDRITVPRAGIVYVVGAVNKPGGFMIKSDDSGMTVLQALAMAEDSKSTAIRSKSVIIRPDHDAPDGHKQIPCDLNLILAAKAPDQKLLPNDILFVPDSAAKKAFARGLEAALQAATGIAIYGRY